MKKSKLETLKVKKEQIEARIKNIESKERLRQKKQDTRRKILIGAFYMEQMDKNEDARKEIIARLDGFLTRPMDRQLFGLPEKSKSRDRTEEKPATMPKPIRQRKSA